MSKRRRKSAPVEYGKSDVGSSSGNRRSKMTSERTLEVAISKDNLESSLLASGLLKAIGMVHRNDDYDISLELPDTIPLKINIKKQEEVEFIKHNG